MLPNVQIKDFNILINEKSFFEMPIKDKEETNEQIMETGETMITRQAIY